MKASTNDSVPTIAWDPKSPATLLLPSISDSTSDNVDTEQKKGSEMVMNYSLCDTGLGCNSFESSAIMNLLDARDAYLDEQKTSSTNATYQHQARRHLSREYRKALENCISDWSEDLEKRHEDEKEEADDLIHLDLLRATYAVTHLSEIFLLTPGGQQEYNGMIGNVGYGYGSEMWNLPGAVTADSVRYLRKHHFGDINNIFDPSAVEGIYELWQPDQPGDGSENIYWEMIEAFIKWGCLEDAWVLLSRHSIVRRFVEMEEQREQMMEDNSGMAFNDYQAASLAEDREGFWALMSILLSAPLPGSRNNTSDEGFDDYDKEDNNNEQNEGELIEGIPSSAYRLWETSSSHGDSNGRTGDYNNSFEPKMADMIHLHWKQAINTSPSLNRLRSRIPQLNKLLCLLAGNFRDIEFNSWQEELCAELLYKNPSIKLMDINVRAAALVTKHSHSVMDDDDNGGNNQVDTMMLNVMRGNAGEVLKALFEFGGGSGAALPAVMTSLLSQLLGDANLLKDPTDTELLIGASSSVRSSLAKEGHHDLGTRLAVRLLLPHIEIDSDLRITASLVDTLEHHSPKSDAEAKGLLALCRKLIERKNVRVLDGCASICLARYRHYMEKHIPGGATHWLLTGMELESLVLCEGSKSSGYWQRSLSSGACYRRLVLDFTQTARSLLKTCLGEEKGASLYYVRGKEMVEVTKEELSIDNFVPAVKLLENIIIIAGAIREKADNSIIANSIVSCLEERPNDEDDGVVSSLARSFSWDLLRLAVEILDMDAERFELQESRDNKKSISSFDVRGMGVLLSVFTIETKAQEMKERNESVTTGLDDEGLHRMRSILGEGLKRAFLAENAMKRTSKGKRSKTSSGTIYTANFSKHSREEQELAVQMMLEF